MKRLSNIFKNVLILFSMSLVIISCNSCNNNADSKEEQKKADDFKFKIDQFADAKVLRYKVPGFENLTLKQKSLVYYLSQAALCGRDIVFDQNGKYNLSIRRTLEAIVDSYKGDKESEDFKNFMTYTKRVWFSNGIHHHYSSDKFIPAFSKEYFTSLVKDCPKDKLPLDKNETVETFLNKIVPIMFDPTIYAKKICLDSKEDLVQCSAVNFYEGVNQKEVETYYKKLRKDNEKEPISYGLNSKVVKENNQVVEKVYKLGGLYSAAIEKIIFWLEKAQKVAENPAQEQVIAKLIEYYNTGDLKTWDEYNVLWVKDLESSIDFVNGFIEVYGDPLATKATWESVVNFKDIEATKRTKIISDNAQWFEDNSPVDKRFKKKEVKGVTAKVITVAQLGGDCYPTTPIGINLPNANWIRKEHGSKSVTMDNITYSYDKSAIGSGFLEEFAYSDEERELAEKYGYIAGNLHTDLHECLGHGSGQLLPNVSDEAMKNYHSALEESRADLFALYFMMDNKMIELGLYNTLDVAKAEYNSYIRNGLMTQLTRIELGKDIEQAHMRNRQLISKWVFEKGQKDNVIEKKIKNGKTYIVINDYNKLRELFGQLLIEMQRIKSEGDYEAGKNIVETYAVKIDPILHKEVKERYEKLNLAPYSGFVNPLLTPVMKDGKIVDIKIEYPDNYVEQMMNYSKNFSFLPTYN